MTLPYAFCVCSAADGSGCNAGWAAIWELRLMGLKVDLPAAYNLKELFKPHGAANCMVLTARGHDAPRLRLWSRKKPVVRAAEVRRIMRRIVSRVADGHNAIREGAAAGASSGGHSTGI